MFPNAYHIQAHKIRDDLYEGRDSLEKIHKADAATLHKNNYDFAAIIFYDFVSGEYGAGDVGTPPGFG